MKVLELVIGSSRRVFLAAVAVALSIAVGAGLSVGLIAGLGSGIVALLVLVLFKFVAEISSQIAGTERTTQQSLKRVCDQLAVIDVETDELRKRLTATAQRLGERATSLEGDVADAISALESTRAAISANTGILSEHTTLIAGNIVALEEVGVRLTSAADSFEFQNQRIDSLQKSFEATASKAHSNSRDVDSLLGLTSQQLGRRVSEEDMASLTTEWTDKLSLPVTERNVRYMERKLVTVEANLIGRIATTTSDAVLRAMIARAIPKRSHRVLEIGVLFAVNAAFLWEIAGAPEGRLHQTLIDPFEGYYGDDALDPLSGLPVRRSIAVENLRRVGVPEANYEIVVGYSGDPAVIDAAAKVDYGLILIDGDHSYEGVVADYRNYIPMLAPGGFMLFDDYGADTWPGVARAVDEIVDSGEVELVGVFGRTAIVRNSGLERPAG
ncbi:hypothetical protein MNBD_ACTINO02-2308 [hydrothermal vent metagenome]|uniref:Uncharacterized protein n=1 Tax=hydrothermal vent metagenome TaxID=652676 RepID=A0A3B0RMK5_9ZZZZ